LPQGVEELRSPTSNGWLIGRTQTNGKSDYESVHQFQAGLKAAPLSAWGKANTPPRGKVDPNVDTRPPVEQVQKMDAATFFGLFTELMKENPPHANDYPMRQRMKRIGMEAGKPFDLAKAAGVVKEALERAPEAGFQRILEVMERGGVKVNGWQLLTSPIGSYGTDYARRASIAYFGLGANLIEDAFYPSALTQADGKPLDGGARYSVHFDKNQIPPVNAFWSITMYDERQLFTANPIGRYAIGDRDPLHFNKDGSLDIYFQRESPGNALEPNWLPTPAKGPFTLTMRLYWPKQAAIDGNWCPPAIQRAA
jgi:hypothetical protein